MAAVMGPIDRLRATTRDAFHQGLRSAQAESPPGLARQLGHLERWLREQERSLDQARRNRGKSLARAEANARKALARAVRRVETLVRP